MSQALEWVKGGVQANEGGSAAFTVLHSDLGCKIDERGPWEGGWRSTKECGDLKQVLSAQTCRLLACKNDVLGEKEPAAPTQPSDVIALRMHSRAGWGTGFGAQGPSGRDSGCGPSGQRGTCRAGWL